MALLDQQREALQREMQEISRERAVEVAAAQERQRQHDTRTSELTSQVARLEATLRDMKRQGETQDQSTDVDAPSNARIQHLTHELEHTRKQLSFTSDQLLRQKNLVESSKTEITTLKGRLETATLRAENAENSLASDASSLYSTRSRRRVT